MDESKLVKTGTTTIGIVCKDGVILAADKKATLGGMIVSNKKTEKVSEQFRVVNAKLDAILKALHKTGD